MNKKKTAFHKNTLHAVPLRTTTAYQAYTSYFSCSLVPLIYLNLAIKMCILTNCHEHIINFFLK